jgi:hypothetical protein
MSQENTSVGDTNMASPSIMGFDPELPHHALQLSSAPEGGSVRIVEGIKEIFLGKGLFCYMDQNKSLTWLETERHVLNNHPDRFKLISKKRQEPQEQSPPGK